MVYVLHISIQLLTPPPEIIVRHVEFELPKAKTELKSVPSTPKHSFS